MSETPRVPTVPTHSASWLRSARGWIGYARGWSTFAVGFAAAFWLGRPNLALAARAAVLVVLPAAVLGLGPVWICNRLPLFEGRRPWLPIVHTILALAFGLSWIAGAWGMKVVAASIEGRPSAPSALVRDRALRSS